MTTKTLIALAPACLVLSACGSNGGAGTTAKDPDAARLRFAECMRKAGVDTKVDANGGMRIRVPGTMDPSRMEKLQRDCTKSSGMPEPQAPSPKMQQEAQDKALRFAACMRANGVHMADPQFDGGGIKMTIQKSVNPKLPRVQKAQQICQKKSGMGGPGGPISAGGGPKGGATFSAP